MEHINMGMVLSKFNLKGKENHFCLFKNCLTDFVK